MRHSQLCPECLLLGVELGRLDAAKSAAVRVLELEPGFTISGMCAAFDIHKSLAVPLGEALSVAGLPA